MFNRAALYFSKMKLLIAAVFMLMVACNAQPGSNKTKFDKLEETFGAGNWRYINEKDTQYLFFSREGAELYKVHYYKLQNGDSVNSYIATIQPENENIVWNLPSDKLMLEFVNDTASLWRSVAGHFKNEFIRQDSAHIIANDIPDKDADKQQFVLVRTLPISTFLIRSKYDFLHGTNTANAIGDTVKQRR